MNTKPRRFLRLPEILERTGLSRTVVERLEAAGRFPKHIKISNQATGWVESEVDDWMDARIAASRGAADAGTHV